MLNISVTVYLLAFVILTDDCYDLPQVLTSKHNISVPRCSKTLNNITNLVMCKSTNSLTLSKRNNAVTLINQDMSMFTTGKKTYSVPGGDGDDDGGEWY